MLELRPVVWVASTKRDLSAFPTEVKREIGNALYDAQAGEKNGIAKAMKGALREVTEIVSNTRDATFRFCYTVKIGDRIYALHAFQKKSKSGIGTPKREIDIITARLKEAKKLAARGI